MSRFTEQEQEAQGVIELLEDDPVAVQAMLLFLYDKPYTDAQGDTTPELVFLVRLYSTADKYSVVELKHQAHARLGQAIQGCWDVADLPVAIREGYHLPALHGISLVPYFEEVCKQHLSKLIQKPEFRKLLVDLPELSLSLLCYATSSISVLNIEGAVEKGPRLCCHCSALFADSYWKRHALELPDSIYLMHCPNCATPVSSRALTRTIPKRRYYQ